MGGSWSASDRRKIDKVNATIHPCWLPEWKGVTCTGTELGVLIPPSDMDTLSWDALPYLGNQEVLILLKTLASFNEC